MNLAAASQVKLTADRDDMEVAARMTWIWRASARAVLVIQANANNWSLRRNLAVVEFDNVSLIVSA